MRTQLSMARMKRNGRKAEREGESQQERNEGNTSKWLRKPRRHERAELVCVGNTVAARARTHHIGLRIHHSRLRRRRHRRCSAARLHGENTYTNAGAHTHASYMQASAVQAQLRRSRSPLAREMKFSELQPSAVSPTSTTNCRQCRTRQ